MSSHEGTIISADRPGCITAYAILLWLASAVLVINTFSALSDPFLGPVAAVCPGLFALVLITVGIGLWQMKPWGWWFVVIVQSLGVLGSLLNVVTGLNAASEIGSSLLLYALVSGVIGSGILYWFITNRDLFLVGHTYQARQNEDGESVTELIAVPKSNVSTALIVGVILLVVVAPVLVIAILTLLGPQIGDVFSRIVDGLAAP